MQFGAITFEGNEMSLILGIYHRSNRISAEAVQPMVDAFSHYSTYLHRRDFPGFILLSVNELQDETAFASNGPGNQLIGFVGSVVENGQVTTPPADGFGAAWKRLGPDCLPQLDGAFCAAIYDPDSHQLTLVNDKFGMRPLFVCATEEYVVFCNEIAPLLHLQGFRFSVNKEAVTDYFCLGTTLGDETLIEGISNLPCAANWVISNATVQKAAYWQPKIPIDRVSSIEEHAKRISEVLKTIVQQLFTQLTNVKCLLSAGADSRLILSCMTPEQLAATKFLTSKLSILEASEDKDLIGATALVSHLGLQHEILEIAFSERDFGQDYFDESQYIRTAKIIGGWHGGEFLGGFCAKAAPIRKELTFDEVDAKLRGIFSWWFRRKLNRHPFDHYRTVLNEMTSENRMLQFQMQQFYRGTFTNIYNGSRGTWLQPFEIINQGFSPFWDSRFLQALLAIPFEMLADYQLYNVIFRDCLTSLAHIPSNSPLTHRPDSALPKMTVGTDPKIALKPKYQNALDQYTADPGTWRRFVYRRRRMRQTLLDGDSPITMQFLDFEAWRRRFSKF